VRVVSAAGAPGITAAQFLRHSTAKPESDADILTLSVTYRKRAPAVRLANADATELKDYKTELQTAKINATIAAIEKTLEPYRVAGKTTDPTYLSLSENEGGLRSCEPPLRPTRAFSAPKVPPRFGRTRSATASSVGRSAYWSEWPWCSVSSPVHEEPIRQEV
jgi:hypothetical protein